jgi:hypothetical protein
MTPSALRARPHAPRRARGIALPVMLVILVVMMVTGIYVLRATHSTALTTGNLAYNTAMSRAVDFGLHAGFQYLNTTAASNKPGLDASDAAHGYEARFDTTLTTRDPAFWTKAVTVTDADNNQIDFVVHRLCLYEKPYDDPTNRCVLTSDNTSLLGNVVALGDSLAADASQFAGTPQVHYVVAARIHGARGGNVINQMVVLIGA